MLPVKYKKLWLALGWTYLGLIFYLCLIPNPPQVAEFEQSDKLKHLGAYGLLMAWFGQIYSPLKIRLAYALLFCGVGVGIEFLQRWGGVRTFEVADMAANAAGVVLGLIFSQRNHLFNGRG